MFDSIFLTTMKTILKVFSKEHFKSWRLSAFVIICSVYGGSALGGSVQVEEERPIQVVNPVTTYNSVLTVDERVKPSSTRILNVGERLAVPYVTGVDQWVVQRLTERTYWLLSNQFAVTLFVGDKSVLMIDAPDVFEIDGFLSQVKKITSLPISTVVYSHPHVDHVGHTGTLAELLAKKGRRLRVIGSENTAREVKRFKNSIPMPTEVLPNGRSTFQFENWTFKYVTPDQWAHTGADSYTITPDGVLHIVDFFYPGRLPMAGVSGAENMTGWINMLRHVAGEKEWKMANLGHANIGYPKDVIVTLDYFSDLYSAAHEVFHGFSGKEFNFFAGENTGVMVRNIFDGASLMITELVSAKWSHYPQWEVARDHAEKVLWEVTLDYNHRTDTVPDFEPIPSQ